jgi:glycerol-3-phosphate dehydrogenase (NAD(P)+)
MRIREINRQIYPGREIAALSVPNLAAEVARGLPTATVLACSQPDYARELQGVLGSPRFRI